ncbi:Protein of unknown function [Alteribacillus persepolensis]|uniref:DUF4025 domain-containing protein n=1 Tax=Alteribacillus persepolensis TaxID=568899 RepID=A0A1G8DT07_9BACI|nr:YozQ family protein [Alteribacillus persepolensis]SDH60735.1 Protein of unknown function [Alteribacillus persepolensis]
MKNKKQRTFDADKTYQSSDYTSQDETARGFAETHEQVSDTMAEGTIDRKASAEKREQGEG